MDDEKKKLKPVVQSNQVTKQKESFGKRLTGAFVQGTKEEIQDYLIHDVLIPGIQNAFLDTMEMIFFDRPRGNRDRGKKDYRASFSGSKRSSSRRDRGESLSKRDRRNDDDVDYRDIVVTNRDEAYEVVDQMHYRIRETGAASIADLLDLVNLPSKPSDNDWGWERENDISVRRVSNGFLIDLGRERYIG